MTESRERSLEYLILRCRERLGVDEGKFWSADYEEQVRWLSYTWLREKEEARVWKAAER